MITPADSASAPDQYAAVAVQSMNIQAEQQDLSAVTAAAVSEANGPRQDQAAVLLHGDDSPSVTAGYAGGAGEYWTSDPRP